MRTSGRGILEICEHEGIVPAPYVDSVGVWTFGVGHTAAAGGPNPESMNKAYPSTDDAIQGGIIKAVKQLGVDLITYEHDVNQAVKVPLEQHEFDALVCFHFNTGGIHRAKLTKAINRGDPEAYRHFMGWLKPTEIAGRRTAEMRLFQTGDYDANGTDIPVWGTDGNGKLTAPVRTIDGAWVLDILGVDQPPPKPIKVPQEALDAIGDADKPIASSTTVWAILGSFGASGYTFWQTADTFTRAAIVVIALGLGYILRERIRKINLGKLAKRALNP